jgi:hypothetical protein
MSTYSPSLRIELIASGTQSGTWGVTTNNNLGDLIEQAIAGVTTVDVTGADVTLTALNGITDQARSAVLNVTGSNVVTRNIIIPNNPKVYIVTNNTSQIVGIKTASGAAFSCAAGTQTTLYCDGSDVVKGPVNIAYSGALTGGTASFTSVTYSGALTGGTADFTNIDYSGALTGGTADFTNIDYSGALTGGTADFTNIDYSGALTGGTGSLTTLQSTSLGVGTAPSGTTGEIRATNNVTAFYSSDRKFKTNIAPVSNALDIVQAIGTKTFDWTDEYLASHGGEDGYFMQKQDFGVIAQDVQAVFPQAVRTRADGSLAVDYEKLSTLAFQALIELTERVKVLEVK